MCHSTLFNLQVRYSPIQAVTFGEPTWANCSDPWPFGPEDPYLRIQRPRVPQEMLFWEWANTKGITLYTLRSLSSNRPLLNPTRAQLGHYLVGLIESDGCIVVPKAKKSPKGTFSRSLAPRTSAHGVRPGNFLPITSSVSFKSLGLSLLDRIERVRM